MPPITQVQRSKVNHELKRLGFTGINDPNLFAQIGTLYTTHDSFRGLLMSTAQDQRHIAYEWHFICGSSRWDRGDCGRTYVFSRAFTRANCRAFPDVQRKAVLTSRQEQGARRCLL